jgi:hypothetical protein
MFSQLHILHKMGRDNFDLGLKLFGATNHISQAITQEIADYTRRALRQSASACEKLADATTIDATIDVQRDHAKAALEDFIAQSDKMGELYLALAKESAETLETVLEKRSVEGPQNAASEERPSIHANADISPVVVGPPMPPPERSAIRSVVANAAKEAAEAARQSNAGHN